MYWTVAIGSRSLVLEHDQSVHVQIFSGRVIDTSVPCKCENVEVTTYDVLRVRVNSAGTGVDMAWYAIDARDRHVVKSPFSPCAVLQSVRCDHSFLEVNLLKCGVYVDGAGSLSYESAI